MWALEYANPEDSLDKMRADIAAMKKKEDKKEDKEENKFSPANLISPYKVTDFIVANKM